MEARNEALFNLRPFPLAPPDTRVRDLDEAVFQPIERRASWRWWAAFGVSAALLALFAVCATVTVVGGIGLWGVNNPVGWAFGITNLVFWIGIGHAGTLISAILYLLRQHWRTAIARFAEAMTLFAVLCAVQFPVLHTGRPWLAIYWMFPYPNHNSIWPNFRSPLEWDVFAISTYGLVSLLFWYTGLIPDLATARDRAKTPLRKAVFGLLSLGWTGSARAWNHYERAYLLLAGLATPLVLSVHSVISFDFAVSIVPGWHTTIFPPYFVAGAIFSGFAMVSFGIVFLRWAFGLEHLISKDHLDVMNKVMIATSLMVGYAYGMEFFTAWYSGVLSEKAVFLNRALGPYSWAYWTMVTCNVLIPQFLWFGRVRRTPMLLFPIVVAVNVGMWFERFVIIVTSLHRDYLPSAWGMYHPTWVEVGLLAGSFGLFFTCLLLFVRFLPAISVTELKGAVAAEEKGHA